jgi:hypothetical protein
MTHEELRDSYELYALGVADPAPREEIRGHLQRGCEVCMSEMKRARTMATLLGEAVGEGAPSPKLRRRILASVGLEQRRFGWAPFLAAATLLALFAAFYFSGREREFANLALRRDLQLRDQAIQLTKLNEAFAILNSGETTVTSFGKGPKGKVFVNPTRGVLLIASNLPQTPAGKVYEMWVVPKGGKAPVPAGLFQSDANGNAMHIQRGPVDMTDAAAVAVTVENEGGASTPTMPILIVAPLG